MTERLSGFQKLEDFLFKSTGLRILASGILVKYSNTLPKIDDNHALCIPDVLTLSVLQTRRGNQLCEGSHNKAHLQWNSINTTISVFRTKIWAEIFRKIGCGSSIHLLKNACILQRINNNYVLLSGDINSVQEKKPKTTSIQRRDIFRGRPSDLEIRKEAAYDAIFQNIVISLKNEDLMRRRVEKCITKYSTLQITSIFRSYVLGKRKSLSENSIIEDQISPEIIANFLFIVSKKFLRPVLGLESFRILKGKLVLLLKRNLFESINHEDLSNHFKASTFKLFTGCASLSNSHRLKIIKNLMTFLFTSIFLKIVDFYFYSTTASFSKWKIYYFTRIDWQTKTAKFFIKHMETYEQTSETPDFATLRCIPKEAGFRVITNCSRLTNYRANQIKKKLIGNKGSNLKQSEIGPDVFSKQVEIISGRSESGARNHRDIYSCYDQKRSMASDSKQKITEKLGDYRNNNTLNTKVSFIVPILKKLATNLKRFSLMQCFDIKSSHLKYMRNKRGRMLLMKIDLEKCFDNIPHAELMYVINQVLDKDVYYVRDFTILKESNYQSRMETRFFKHSPDILYPMYMPEAQPIEICDLGKEGICVLKENRTNAVNRTTVIEKIRHVIKCSTVIHNNKHYMHKVGIQQGCSISPYLCSIYLSALDQEFPDLDWEIVRYVDDFFVATEHPENILRFLKISESLRSRGVIINPEKMSSNFDLVQLQKTGEAVFTTDYVDWCGMRIYDTGYAIKSICKDPYFRFSVYIGDFERGKRIMEKIKRSLGRKLNHVCMNRHNRKIGECIFDAFQFVSRRLKVMILRADFVNQNFINKILEWCVCEVKRVLEVKGVIFDGEKVDSMANKAYENTEIKNLKRKKWC